MADSKLNKGILKKLKDEPILVLGGIMTVCWGFLVLNRIMALFFELRLIHTNWAFWGFIYSYASWSVLGFSGILQKTETNHETFLYMLITPVKNTSESLMAVIKNKNFWIAMWMLIMPMTILFLTELGEGGWGYVFVAPYIFLMMVMCFRKIEIIFFLLIFIILNMSVSGVPFSSEISEQTLIILRFTLPFLLAHALNIILEKKRLKEIVNVLSVIIFIIVFFFFSVYSASIIDNKTLILFYLTIYLAMIFLNMKFKKMAL